MQFYMPVKVYQESECVKRQRKIFGRMGTRALVVTGRHSARANGALQDVQEVLETEGIPYDLFDEVEENPSVETVLKARTLGLQTGADFVIGIGGGSPMDAAKAIALLLYFSDEDADFLCDNSKSKTVRDLEEAKDGKGALTANSAAFAAAGAAVHVPLLLIPTTCGTGSEVTGVSVLTQHRKKTKGSIPHKIFADAAFVDGKYLKYAPFHVIRNTAADALGHLWESLCNSGADPYSRMCAEAGLHTWSKVRDVLLHLEERELTKEELDLLMEASTFAGMAIAQTGTGLPHALSYALTYDLHIPHGAAVGLFEAGYLEQVEEGLREKALGLAGFSGPDEWREYYHIVCGELAIPAEELEHTVEMVAANPAKLATAPFACDEAVLRKIVFGG
jgi:alcohol dehydrogenase class IV